jgi:hypothetical protein
LLSLVPCSRKGIDSAENRKVLSVGHHLSFLTIAKENKPLDFTLYMG